MDHQFLSNLEEKKSALAKDLMTETEQLKAVILKDVEREKRQLDEEFRRKTRLFDQMSSLYEAFHLEYGTIISEIYALDGEYIDKLNSIDPRLGEGVRASFLSKVHRRLIETQEKLAPFQAYISSDYNLRIAKLFAALSTFMADGAKDRKRLDELALEHGMIAVELQSELLGETHGYSSARK